MRRHSYNRYRYQQNGFAVKLFRCPVCGEPLEHYYPRRCKCGNKVMSAKKILQLGGENYPPLSLSGAITDPGFIHDKFGSNAIILIAGCADITRITSLSGEYGTELIIADTDASRLSETGKIAKKLCSGQLLPALMPLMPLPICDNILDAVVDNTDGGFDGEFIRALKPGGCIVRGGKITYEKPAAESPNT